MLPQNRDITVNVHNVMALYMILYGQGTGVAHNTAISTIPAYHPSLPSQRSLIGDHSEAIGDLLRTLQSYR